MKKVMTVISVVGMVSFAACAKDPTKDSTKAEVNKAVQPETPAPESAQGLPINPMSSKVAFVGAKVTAQHSGRFEDFNGTIELVGNDPAKSKVQFEVKTASLKVDEDLPKLEGHLKSADFFDVEKFPSATFVSTEIKPGSETPGMNFTVTGNLQIKETKKSITIPAKIDVTPNAVNVKSEFGINRKDFGIVYPGMPDDLIKDNVLIKLDLVTNRSPS
jgi:polyisoprenoid-binding protein YceI